MFKKRKALFLDIDGTVIHDPTYLNQPSQLEFLSRALEALHRAQKKGFILIFISNKGGSFYHKGLTDDGLKILDREFKDRLYQAGLNMDRVATYYCPHYPKKNKQCTCRKPKNSLFLKAIEDHKINIKSSSVIGDKVSDLIPGINVGCKKAILVKRNGNYYEEYNSRKKIYYEKFDNLSQAIDRIISS